MFAVRTGWHGSLTTPFTIKQYQRFNISQHPGSRAACGCWIQQSRYEISCVFDAGKLFHKWQRQPSLPFTTELLLLLTSCDWIPAPHLCIVKQSCKMKSFPNRKHRTIHRHSSDVMSIDPMTLEPVSDLLCRNDPDARVQMHNCRHQQHTS